MAVNESHTTAAPAVNEQRSQARMTDDRYCRHCCKIALAYDPAVSQARCRACGELA